MTVAVRDVTLFQAGFDDLCPGLAALGGVAAELALTRALTLPAPLASLRRGLSADTPEALATVRAVYAESGCAVCALFLPTNFNAPRPEPEIAWTVAAVRVAAGLGVGVVRVDGAMSGPDHLSRRRRVALFQEALESILGATEGSPVRLAIENHGRQGNDLPWLEAVLELTDPARVGLTLDPANLYWAGCPLEQVYAVAERLAPRVFHVHVKNVRYPAASRSQPHLSAWEYGRHVAPIPEGDLDWSRLIGRLGVAGYAGALAIEDESLPLFPPAERPELLRQAVAYLRGVAVSL